MEDKKLEITEKLKALYRAANLNEKTRLKEILKVVSKDPNYKDNMVHYFKQFLLERY